jgi:predicted secreted hydrolase
VHFIHGDDKHDYCVVGCLSNFGHEEIMTYATVMDITKKTYYGETFHSPGQMSNNATAGDSGLLRIWATTEDQFSEIKIVSKIPKASYDFTLTPRGPILYQAGGGVYNWGIGTASAFDIPETKLTGTLTVDGKKVNVVPEKSMGWFDWQWGPGYAPEGWHGNVILLDNGVKIVIMVTNPSTEYSQVSVATMLFPDGHHEIYPVDPDIHPSDPWVSQDSGLTYYNKYLLNIPGKMTVLKSRLWMEGGEATYLPDPSKMNSINDAYATYTGIFDGKLVTGWGIQERRVG